jgi:NAD(P)-dependent dehydrogenase (short-subunit alcohol dehydrogenase family)
MRGDTKPKRRVAVIGALGGVGRGIVGAILERYSRAIEALIITSRDRENLAEFHASIETTPLVVPTVGSVATSAEANRLRDAILQHGPIDIVIASLGGWWSGSSFTDIDDATWQSTMGSLLTTHAVCARAFVPILAGEDARYLIIGGGAALRPVPGSSLVSIAGAAQAMMTRVLVAERADPPRPLIHEFLIDGPIATDAPHHGPLTIGEITASDVGRAAAAWCLGETSGGRPRFDWPKNLLSRDGPITTMRPRPRPLASEATDSRRQRQQNVLG